MKFNSICIALNHNYSLKGLSRPVFMTLPPDQLLLYKALLFYLDKRHIQGIEKQDKAQALISITVPGLLYNIAFTFTHVHPHTDGGVGHAGRQPARRGAVRVEASRSGNTSTLGGAGDRTSDPPVTSQSAVPPEPHAAPIKVALSS